MLNTHTIRSLKLELLSQVHGTRERRALTHRPPLLIAILLPDARRTHAGGRRSVERRRALARMWY
jgi:hypothetical protein